MMKYFLLFVTSGLVVLLTGPFLPHWGLMLVIAVTAALVGGNSLRSFFSAALAWGIVWFAVPLLIMLKTGSDLPEKIGGIMGISNEIFLVAATALTGFLMGGLGALTGNLFGKLFEKDMRRF